jgi:uncharacterized membrane protein
MDATPFLISFGILIAAIVLFFILARRRYIQFGTPQALLRILATLPLLISAVVLHLVHRNEATAMIPPVAPSPIFFVLFTGVLEIAGAIGLFVPRLRRSAALWISILMVLIFPANIWVAGQTYLGLQMPSVPVRLAMQVIYIWMVLLAGYGLPRLSNRASANSTR